MRIRLLIGSLILALGLVTAQMPVRHSMADISGCYGGCAQVPTMSAGGN
jgi:hypothetical protein